MKNILPTHEIVCVLCHKKVNEFGNNPWPLAEVATAEDGLCCDHCNETKVIPARNKYYKKEEVL